MFLTGSNDELTDFFENLQLSEKSVSIQSTGHEGQNNKKEKESFSIILNSVFLPSLFLF